MDIPPDALGFAVVVASIIGTAFGVKFLVWGKGPIRRLRGGGADPALEERVAELEERLQQISDVLVDQSHRLEDYDERLDFTERVLTRELPEGRKPEPPAE